MRTLFGMGALVALAFAALALAGAAAARPSPATWADLHGARHDPLSRGGHRATVLFFIAHECPLSNQYAPEMKRICGTYESRGIAFYVVYAEPRLSRAAAARHARQYGYRCPVLLDPTLTLSRAVGATVTPEAAVLGPDGKRVYLGRIDDQYIDLATQRFAVTRRDLRLALDGLLAGRKLEPSKTPAVGCFISTFGVARGRA